MHWGVFERIYVNYLPVGHTHEDIDQFFSCINRYMRSHNAYSLADFLGNISRSCKKGGQKVNVGHWNTVPNFSAWIEPHICARSSIEGVQEFRSFKFVRCVEDKQVWMLVRTSPASLSSNKKDQWRGLGKHCNHTVLFPGGEPPLLRDILAGNMPHAATSQASEKDTFPLTCSKIRKGFQEIAAQVKAFTDEAQGSLLEVLDKMEGEPEAFGWTEAVQNSFL